MEPAHVPPNISSDEAMQRLIAGNERFRSGAAHQWQLPREKLIELSHSQHPYATILGCSDSRVPPEWIFDAGLGELFVIRVAGNVLSTGVLGSLQYAKSHLRTPLFVILGHEGCGVVKAALETRTQGIQHRSRIQILVDTILPDLPESDPSASPEIQLSHAVEANVRRILREIRATPEVKARAAGIDMKLVGAVYELESGNVRWL